MTPQREPTTEKKKPMHALISNLVDHLLFGLDCNQSMGERLTETYRDRDDTKADALVKNPSQQPSSSTPNLVKTHRSPNLPSVSTQLADSSAFSLSLIPVALLARLSSPAGFYSISYDWRGTLRSF